MTSAPKNDEPIDEYAATVVLDERIGTRDRVDATGKTPAGGPTRESDAARRRDARR